MFLELIKKFSASICNSFLNLIFDKKCIICSCSKTDDFLCKTCAKDIQYLSTFPHKIYNNIPIYSVTSYSGTIKQLIHNFKFKHKKSISKFFARLLFNYFSKIKENKDYIICFVPSYFIKSAQRGYNHMHIIAKEFSSLSNIEINKNIVKKIKYTKPQYKVKNRHLNIKDSFKINKKYINTNKTIILIDDITTSGATLEEIINCFQKNGINNILCLTIAKA